MNDEILSHMMKNAPTAWSVVDTRDDVHSTDHLSEDRMLRWSRLVKEIQETVMNRVNEDLRSSRIRLASVLLEKSAINA
jgi:hypothetical protein